MNFFSAIIITISNVLILMNLKIVKVTYKDILALIIGNFVIIITVLSYKKQLAVPILLIFKILYLNHINKEYKENILLAIMTIFIGFISDVIVSIFIFKICDVSMAELVNNLRLHIITHILVLIVTFIISRILGNIFKRVNLFKIDGKIVKVLLINLGIALIMIYIIGNVYIFSGENNVILILNLAFLIIYCLLITYISKLYINVSKKEIKYKYKDKELEQLKEYISMVEITNSDIRRFKHDYLNILSTINYYIENSDFQGFVKYFNESIIPESNNIKHKNLSFNNLKYIKIAPIKGLLSYKIGRAQELDIEVTVSVLDKIEEVSINIVDLSRILGILLDNAIEEAIMCENKAIEINIIKGNKAKVFVIANTCRSNLPPIYNMMQKGFSTKGDNRGLGLSNIQEIIYGEYENVTLNTYIEDRIFKQEFIIED